MSMFPTTTTSISELATALAVTPIPSTASGGDGGFLKFDYKTGEWDFGKAGDDVSNEEILVNSFTLEHGWVIWSGGVPSKSMASFRDPVPPAPAPIGKDYPKEAVGFTGAFNDGLAFQFDSSSYGGRKGWDALRTALNARAVANPGSEYLFPKCTLASESYNHAQYGILFNPVFEIVAWCNVDGDVEAEPAPVIEETPAPEPDAPAPKTRRRRRTTAA